MSVNGKMQPLQVVAGTRRDPRALTTPDWVVLALLALILLLAPLVAGRFATAPDMGFLPLSGTLDWLQALGIPVMALLMGAALLIAIWREGQRPVAIGAVPALTGAALLMALWAALSLVRSPTLSTGLNALMALLMTLAWSGLAARLSRDRRALTVLFVTLIAAGTLGAALGLQEYVAKWKEGSALHRTFGAFLNPDFLAGYLLLTLPVTAAAFTGAKDRLSRLALGVALLLQTMCLMLTGSRTGLAALAAGMLVWTALSVWSGAARQRWKWLGAALALVVIGAVLASAPTRARLSEPSFAAAAGRHASPAPAGAGQHDEAQASAPATATTTKSQSFAFRRWTWHGTIELIKTNPLLGTGLGSFELAYPRYAVTAFTAHAHNSLLQWTGDTGLPGAILLLTVLAAATAFSFNVLRLRRATLEEETDPEAAASPEETRDALSAEPALLIAGLFGALAASALKTFLDSDWFIVATALALGAVVTLLTGLARDVAPLTTQRPQPLSRSFLAACAIPALFLLWRGSATAIARIDIAQGAQSLQDQRPPQAIDAFRQAADADPFDPGPHLTLAEIYGSMGRSEDQKQEILTAIRIGPVAKAYYRLGQYFDRSSDAAQAVAAYRKARALDPNNLQTLHRLADALHRAGRDEEAIAAYHAMTDLETAPYGTVRAMADEMIETEFAYAHYGLASIALERHQIAEAAKEAEGAAQVMRAYWLRRNWIAYSQMPPVKRTLLADLYHKTLALKLDAQKALGAPAAEIAHITDEQSRMEADQQLDLQHDQEARRKAPVDGMNP